jgi:hypothetical protein
MKVNKYVPPFIFCLALLIMLAISTSAQQTAFRPGDRVSASPLSLKDEKYWRACTVTEVHNFVPKRAYSVTCDPQTKGGSPASFLVNEDWVKPLSTQEDNAEPVTPGVRPPAPAAGPGNGAVACEPSDPGSGKNAMDNAFRAAIVQGFEREPSPGADGRVTVTIQSLNVGASHPYRVYEDPNEARGKTIYEVRSIFTACTDYNRRIVLVKRERAFSCYKNTAGQWVCDIHAAVNTTIKDETRSIDKKR